MQLFIAVILLALSHFLKVIHLTFRLERSTLKALLPIIALTVLGLK